MRTVSPPREVPYLAKKGVVNLEDALVTALYFNAFIRHAGSIRFANFPPMSTAIGINEFRLEAPVLLQAMFFPFEIYGLTCGKLSLDVFYDSDTFSGTYKDRKYSGIRTLDVSATLDESLKQLVVNVVNQSPNKYFETTVSLISGEFGGNIKVFVVNGPGIKSENTEEKPDQVGVKEVTLKVAGASLIYNFEPHSITTFVCPIR